jgi:hypothetical protein
MLEDLLMPPRCPRKSTGSRLTHDCSISSSTNHPTVAHPLDLDILGDQIAQLDHLLPADSKQVSTWML